MEAQTNTRCPTCGQPRATKQQTTLLSRRHVEVLEQLARGCTKQQVAQRLGISPNTVKIHVNSIQRRLGVHNSTAAVVYALRERWIALPEKEQSSQLVAP